MRDLRAASLLVVCLAHTSLGAERVDIKALLQHVMRKRHAVSEPVTSYRSIRDASKVRRDELDDVMALGQDTKLDIVKVKSTVQGTQLVKMQERYQGRVVSDGIVTIETDSSGDHVLDASGSVYRNIGSDLDLEREELDPEQALTVCLSEHADEGLRDDITHVKVESEVLIDDEMAAYGAYLVQYLVLLEGEDERRPTCIVHATHGQVVMAWDALDSCSDCTATGTGGNLKTGKVRYGELQRCLDVRREDGKCYLENQYVRVINNNHTEVRKNETWEPEAEVAWYDCVEIEDEVNGAFSPLLDAFFHGTVVARMYEDWYNTTAVGERLTFKVHFGANVSNAFWTGYECLFGDGGEEVYPLVSLDIVGHEVGHAVTEINADLYYFNQWGGINEAFSDMAGETAEAYLQEADWLIGIDVSKGNKPLRFMDDPERDNMSISHVSSYNDSMNVHFSSGVFNHVFYVLVHNYSIPARDVFGTFLHANQMYWHHMSSYVTAACDVMMAAYDLGQDGGKFRMAFRAVGIEACDVDDHVVWLREEDEYTDISVSAHASPTFFFAIPSFARSVTVNASSPSGEVYLSVSNATWGVEQGEEGEVEVFAEGFTLLHFDAPVNTSLHLSITLSTNSSAPLSDVMLLATYDCVEAFTPDYNDPSSFDVYRLWKKTCDTQDDADDEDKSDEDCDKDNGNEDEEKDEEKDEKW
ncbi:hypothetical protein V1264_018160 [Littorina saxatilis]|uniref:Neutral metalloproteinase n=1 Tax=Littorina saxatilis TaxID=31220 RepID=A0AAN9BEF1_9CAEN